MAIIILQLMQSEPRHEIRMKLTKSGDRYLYSLNEIHVNGSIKQLSSGWITEKELKILSYLVNLQEEKEADDT